ncbi:MAG: glycosyltransferase family 1 protein [bacterium]
MNIAIDVRSLMEDRHSGVQEYTVQIIRALVRVAPRHTYHLFYNSARTVALPDFGSRCVVHKFRYPNKIFNAAQFVFGLPRWDKLVPADCYFVPNVRLMPLGPMAPLVVVAHDLSYERFPELYSWQRRVWHRLVQARFLLQNADQVVAVSEATAEDVRLLYRVPENQVSVIYSGVPEAGEVSSKTRAAVKARYNLPERFVLYLGTLEPRKNVVSIVRAFDNIADSIPHGLVIAGSPGWLMKEFDKVLIGTGHRSRIQVTGFIREQDKMALYEMADLFVYPSLYEGFGFPPLEALLNGTPVITSLNSALPEVVGEWAILIDPYDTGELALVMKELLQDLPVVSEEDRRAIREKYSWDEAARQTLKIIESVA